MAAHTDGDNTHVVATDTMKNTAYAFAKDHLDGVDRGVRRWPSREHFLAFPQVSARPSTSAEHGWRTIDVDGAPAPDAFVRGGRGDPGRDGRRDRGGTFVEAGVEDLIVMKTTRSSFSGFPRDGTPRCPRPTTG